MSDARIEWVDAKGVRLRAVVEGAKAARPVLFLHGFTGAAGSMEGAARAVTPDRRAVRLELVGHGAVSYTHLTLPTIYSV